MTPAAAHTAQARRRPRTRFRRRRLVGAALAALGTLAAVAVIAGLGPLDDAFQEITLPLRHDDIIRQQARDKDLDPALIAAVIYQESKFRDQTSHAGARGLMQVTPDTARFIAKRSGGVAFVEEDLATPQINISYGSYYLRYLLDRYDGDDELAVAAYNAGETNVDRWIRKAGGPDDFDRGEIPFPETRHYVAGVEKRREQYRDNYADDLGI